MTWRENEYTAVAYTYTPAKSTKKESTRDSFIFSGEQYSGFLHNLRSESHRIDEMKIMYLICWCAKYVTYANMIFIAQVIVEFIRCICSAANRYRGMNLCVVLLCNDMKRLNDSAFILLANDRNANQTPNE